MQRRPQVGHAVRHMSGAAKESGGSATPLIGLGLALAAGGAGVYFLGAPPPDATEDIMSTTLPASILSKPLDVCFFFWLDVAGLVQRGRERKGAPGVCCSAPASIGGGFLGSGKLRSALR